MSELMSVKVATQLLLPPGCLLLLSCIGLLAGRRWWGRALLVLSLAAFWLLSTAPVRDALTRPLEFQSPTLAASVIANLHQLQPPADTAIVVLGGGTNVHALEYDGEDEPGRYSLMRTVYAARLARQTGLPVYSTGGRPLSVAKESEGAIMRRWLVQLGVPADQAFSEDSSANTWENATHIKRMLQGKGISRVVLVTTAMHMPRARWCFEHQGLVVIAAPTDYLTQQTPYDARSFLPDADVLAESTMALHEYLGLIWYPLRYASHGLDQHHLP
jgi:uncharacterized SAM-binding protein YcdF (DUF218 family)